MSQGGAGLMFITLPKVFSQMAGGRFMGALFFTLVLFAALTSSVSVMEAIVSMMMDRFGLSRIKCCISIVLFSILLGVPCSLGNGIWSGFTIFGMDFLTFCDFISNSILLPVVAFLTCIMIGWFVGRLHYCRSHQKRRNLQAQKYLPHDDPLYRTGTAFNYFSFLYTGAVRCHSVLIMNRIISL